MTKRKTLKGRSRLGHSRIRRPGFPHIELRETAAGRVAYIDETRFAVYWVARAIHNGVTPKAFARRHALSIELVRAALAYADAFSGEIKADLAHARANQQWIKNQEILFQTAAWSEINRALAQSR